MRFEDRPIRDILVTTRHRKNLGDLADLQASMARLGQLQPIGIDSAGTLVFGQRRLEAARALGWETIWCVVLDELDSPLDCLHAERDENECRLPFTKVERAAIFRHIEDAEREKWNQARKDNLRQGKEESPEGDIMSPSEKTQGKPQKRDESARSASRAAKVAGMDRRTVAKVEKVAADGVPELVEAMESDAVSVNAAARLAELPADEQPEALAEVQAGQKPADVVARRKQVEPDPDEEPRDPAGRVIPPQARAAFESVGVLNDLAARIRDFQREIPAVKDSPVGKMMSDTQIIADCKNIRAWLLRARPHRVCPYCETGKASCNVCKGDGWVTEHAWDVWERDNAAANGRARGK